MELFLNLVFQNIGKAKNSLLLILYSRPNIYFNFRSPVPGSFLIGLHYKGRDKPIVEVDMKLDDLLEKQQANEQELELEYVLLNVNKMLHLLNKTFIIKRHQ